MHCCVLCVLCVLYMLHRCRMSSPTDSNNPWRSFKFWANTTPISLRWSSNISRYTRPIESLAGELRSTKQKGGSAASPPQSVENESLPTTSRPEHATSYIQLTAILEPCSHSIRQCSAEGRPSIVKASPKTHVPSGVSVTARSRRKTSLVTSLAWLIPSPPRSTPREAERSASCTPIHAAQKIHIFANVQWLGQMGHVHIRHHPAHPPVHMRALVILTP